MQKWILSFIMVALLATPAMAFKDVPPNHWAYDAINKAVEAGILQGYNNLFHGKKTLNRFQMAVVVARMLDKIGTGGGAGVDKDALKQLEALVTEFADELALLNVKVGKLEETVANMNGKPAMRAAAPVMGGSGVGIANGNLKIGGIFKNAYMMQDRDLSQALGATNNWDFNSFQLRNARLLFWHKFSDDISLFVQTEHARNLALSEIANGGNDIQDVRVDIKLPNSENTISFGRFLPPITHYMHKNITELDFIAYPIVTGRMGIYQVAGFGGIWRQDGLMFSFGEDTKIKFGIFNGGDAGSSVVAATGLLGGGAPTQATGLPGLGVNTGLGVDDEDKAMMLAIDFKGTDKMDYGFFYYKDEDTADAAIAANVSAEYDALGLWFSYKHESFNLLLEYITQEWDGRIVGPVAVAEADSMMLQFIVPMQKNKTDFMLRYEDYDADGTFYVVPGGNADAGDWKRITLGFRWKMHERCTWQLEYWDDEFNGGNSAVAGMFGNEPSTIITQLMVWF